MEVLYLHLRLDGFAHRPELVDPSRKVGNPEVDLSVQLGHRSDIPEMLEHHDVLRGKV